MATLSYEHVTETGSQTGPFEFALLHDRSEIDVADHELQEQGLVAPAPDIGAMNRMIRRLQGHDPTPPLKRWDIQRALGAMTDRLDPDDAILDVGCFACDMLPALKRLGYRTLFGIDLNPGVLEMPHADVINYAVGDLLSTPWPDGQFAGISAISVIEHGVSDDDLCREVSRLLRPGGIFAFTTDYWPDKVATDTRMFGRDWRIFDAIEIEALVSTARTYNLHPVSDPGSAIRAIDRPPIHFEGKDYTFLYGAFVRGDG